MIALPADWRRRLQAATGAPLRVIDPHTGLPAAAERILRPAGVLCPILAESPAGPAVLLTLRRPDLSRHAGEVSLPGGRPEPGEDLLACALRETWEETGLDPAAIRVLGPLDQVVTSTGFQMHVWLGLVEDPAGTRSLAAEAGEVAALLLLPLGQLLDPAERREHRWISRLGPERTGPAWDLDGHRIWGATATLLEALVTRWEAAG